MRKEARTGKEADVPHHNNEMHVSKFPKSNQGNGAARRWRKLLEEPMDKTHHEEGGVHHSSGCRYDLPPSSVERLLSNDGVQDLKLDVPNSCGRESRMIPTRKSTLRNPPPLPTLTLIAQGPLPGAPLEALNDAVFNRAQQRLVHLRG